MTFSTGFMSGMQARDLKAKRDEDEQRKAELAAIANAKPSEIQGFTADQGEQLRAAAESGQYEIGYNPDTKAYTVTGKAGGPSGAVAMQPVTEFLGTRTQGTLAPEAENSARMQAMSGVVAKYDPLEGVRLQRMANEGAREDQRFAREKQGWQVQDDNLAKQREYEEGRKATFANTRFAQNQAAHDAAVAEYQTKQAEYERLKAAGVEPRMLDHAKPGDAPVRPAYSVGDSLLDRASLVDHEARFGRLTPEQFGTFTDVMNKVQNEGYEKALRLAHSGAGLDQVAAAYNEMGGSKFDPKAVVSDKTMPGPNGVATRVITFKDDKGQSHTINTTAELDSLGKAGEIFARHYQGKADTRADRADARAGAAAGRAAASDAEGRTRDKARAAAAVELFKEQNPSATPAQIEAVRAGVIPAVASTDHNAPAEVKLANAYRRAGLAKTDAEALKLATQTKADSPAKIRAEIYSKALATSFNNPDQARAATDEAMKYLYPEQDAAPSGPPKVSTQADYDKLKSGETYMGEDGKKYRKP